VRNYIRFLTATCPLSYNYSQCKLDILLINVPIRLLVVSTVRWAKITLPAMHQQITLHKWPTFYVCLLNKEQLCSTQPEAVRF